MTKLRLITFSSAGLAGALLLVLVLAYVISSRPVRWEQPSSDLDNLVSNWASLSSLPGVILHIQKGNDIAYAQSAGWLSHDEKTPLTPQTRFHTASVGKLFTAVTILRLHERGLIDLDKPIAQYIGADWTQGLVDIGSIDYGDRITTRQLLSHRAGLPNTDDDLGYGLFILMDPDKKRSPRDLLDQAQNIAPPGPPGAQTSYASPGYFLLGLVIEKVTGMPYHLAARREVFDRLGMGETVESNSEAWSHDDTLHHYANGIDLSTFDPSFEFADGGFVTSAADLTRFGRAILDETLFDKPSTQTLFLSDPADPTAPKGDAIFAALGPKVIWQGGVRQVIRHSGFWGVNFLVYPCEDIVAVMTLAHAQADYTSFWEQAKQLAARDMGLFSTPACNGVQNQR